MRRELEKIGIDLRGKSAGKIKTNCPQCSPDTKSKNLSVNIDEGLYKCHRCQWAGSAKPSQWVRPQLRSTTPEGIVFDWFASRGISKRTVETSGVEMTKGKGIWITFPFKRNGQVINAKHRRLDKKAFMQEPGAESIFWGLDDLGDSNQIIIVEGEIDKLSFHEAGYRNVLSVPQGGSDSLQCLTNCFEYFSNDKEILICSDKDAVGKDLEAKLLDRFGRDRCAIIDLPEGCKDANDVIRPDGPLSDLEADARVETLRRAIHNRRLLPIEGVVYLDDIQDTMLHTFRNGKPVGSSCHFERLSGIYTWLKGQLKGVTGIPGHGKSEWEKGLMLVKSIADGWKWACFDPECSGPEEFFDGLICAYVGKGTELDAKIRMTEAEYIDAMDFVKGHFFLIEPKEDLHSPDLIREKIKSLALRHGIDGALIDPYNQLDHDYTGFPREDMYLSHDLKQWKRLAKTHNLCVSIVAHPSKPQRVVVNGKFEGYAVPDAYSLSGGAMWNNKLDVVCAIHRPLIHEDIRDPNVEVHFHKIKSQKRVGIPGYASFFFVREQTRYTEAGSSPIERLRRKSRVIPEPEIEHENDFMDFFES